MKGTKHVFKLEDLRKTPAAKLNPHLFTDVKHEKEKKLSKFGNKRTEYEGVKFPSIREMNRYKTLLLLLKAGKIGQLRLQVPYELNDGGTHSLKYIADFVYLDAETGVEIVEDAKGFKTREYRHKKRLMKKILGITIKET